MNRREFLKGSALLGAAAMAEGCATSGLFGPSGAPMARYAAKPLEKVRFGVIGMGQRGMPAVKRLSGTPGAELVAMCDVRPEAIEEARKFFADRGEKCPKAYLGPEAWKALCDDPDVDFVYNCTPWDLHVAPAIRAMENGKHVGIEVPAAPTVEDAWALVETAERTRRHCMMLENGCYNHRRISALNLCRTGLIGDVYYGEAYYAHDLRGLFYPGLDQERKGWYSEHWRIEWFRHHHGNTYPTHGLGPLAQIMDIGRGDQFDYLVSMETPAFGQQAYGEWKYGKAEIAKRAPVINGDTNTTLIRTKNGKTIYLVHDVTSPRPQRRLGFIQGTKGALDVDPDFKVAFETVPNRKIDESLPVYDQVPESEVWHSEINGTPVLQKYLHPYVAAAELLALKVSSRNGVGGHNVVDALMDLRIVHCLRKGLPLDQNVYDLAAWSSVCELSERSVVNRSQAIDFPDFTRGAWKTLPRFDISAADIAAMDLKV